MKALFIIPLAVIASSVTAGCNTFNGAVDGTQQIMNSAVDGAQTLVSDTAKGVGQGSATFVEGIAQDIRDASEGG